METFFVVGHREITEIEFNNIQEREKLCMLIDGKGKKHFYRKNQNNIPIEGGESVYNFYRQHPETNDW